MTEYYELKMNLLPSVLAQYNEKKKLYENIIPKFLIKTFNLIEQKEYSIEEVNGPSGQLNLFDNAVPLPQKIKGYSFNRKITTKNIEMSSEYKNLLESYTAAFNEYKKIVDSVQEQDGIYWPNKFLNATKPRLNNALNDFKRKFPDVYNSSKHISTRTVSVKLPGNNQFGHCRTQLIEVLKIKKYLEDNPQRKKMISFIYTVNEHIFVSLEMEDRIDENIRLIQDTINASNPPFGKVTIVPIYADIQISSSIKNITFSFVYPNGENGRKDRSKIDKDEGEKMEFLRYLMNDEDSEKDSPSSGSISISTEEELTPSFIEKTAKKLGASTGYLTNIQDKAKKGIRKIIKKVTFI